MSTSNWNASIGAMQDVTDGNDGAIVRLNGGYRFPIGQSFRLGVGPFGTRADDDYMEAYFEIDAADSTRNIIKRI